MEVKFVVGTWVHSTALLHVVNVFLDPYAVMHSNATQVMRYMTQGAPRVMMVLAFQFAVDQKLTMELNIIVSIKIVKRQLIHVWAPPMEMK